MIGGWGRLQLWGWVSGELHLLHVLKDDEVHVRRTRERARIGEVPNANPLLVSGLGTERAPGWKFQAKAPF